VKLLFLDASPIYFTVATPFDEPLGGTQSCVAYLARALAANGHDITLMANLPTGTKDRIAHVRHLPLAASTAEFFASEDFDAIIALSYPGAARTLKLAAPRAFHVAWLHLLPDHPPMAGLAAMTPFIDCAVMVSRYQRNVSGFGGSTQVIGNAISPAFENMFDSAAQLHKTKENRAVYASVPDRGLDVLANIFERAKIDTALDVYSSMRLYQKPDSDFASLYSRLSFLPRSRHYGVVGQTELAHRFRGAAFFVYPATLPETSCIVAMEAMAAGLKLIVSDMGALSETTQGFADIVAVPPQMDRASLANAFVPKLEMAEALFKADPVAWAEERFAQIHAINGKCTWILRAQEWEAFLQPQIARRRTA
jgi:glycosyltransferase involved in cell wall biosynthesis